MAPFVLQHQTRTRLRDENRSLQDQARQGKVFREENEKLPSQLLAARKVQTLNKAQMTELLRLRGEVGPLRRDSQELAVVAKLFPRS